MLEQPQTLLTAKGHQRYENNAIKSHTKGYTVADIDIGGGDLKLPQLSRNNTSIKITRYYDRGFNLDF